MQKIPTGLDYNIMFCQIVILIYAPKIKRLNAFELFYYLNTEADSLNSSRNRSTEKSAKQFWKNFW